ncbi:MAG TPA: dephospho-CoA kinase [Actinomycetales bacterium]|nr:dephospho-CoA kinase [Actinomycetales bacterium]
MLRVGLTGGTGAGKTTVASRLRDLGAIVIDADVLAREVVAPGSEGLAAVVEEFGAGVLSGDGALDRPALAALVFADSGRRQVLERITHPRIAVRTAEIMATAAEDAIIVHDVPLLVEKHMGAGYHLVIVVTADAQTRVRRLVQSRGMAEDDAWSRVRAQASDEERRAAADVLLDNSGEPDVVLGDVDKLWHERLVPFEANVRGRRPAEGPAPDLSDRALVTRVSERLLRAADVPGARVGVAGCALRLHLPAASEHAEVSERLAEAGFPRFSSCSGGEGTVHGSADPGCTVTVRVGV